MERARANKEKIDLWVGEDVGEVLDSGGVEVCLGGELLHLQRAVGPRSRLVFGYGAWR